MNYLELSVLNNYFKLHINLVKVLMKISAANSVTAKGAFTHQFNRRNQSIVC